MFTFITVCTKSKEACIVMWVGYLNGSYEKMGGDGGGGGLYCITSSFKTMCELCTTSRYLSETLKWFTIQGYKCYQCVVLTPHEHRTNTNSY